MGLLWFSPPQLSEASFCNLLLFLSQSKTFPTLQTYFTPPLTYPQFYIHSLKQKQKSNEPICSLLSSLY